MPIATGYQASRGCTAKFFNVERRFLVGACLVILVMPIALCVAYFGYRNNFFSVSSVYMAG